MIEHVSGDENKLIRTSLVDFLASLSDSQICDAES